MLSEKIEKTLNNQIEQEAYAAYFYLAMASWCEYKGLHGCAKFLYQQSQEERDHMLRIFKYINDTGGHALSPVIPKMQKDYISVVEVFENGLKQEQANTKSINNLVELCLKTRDYSTFNFLQWYVAEQHEEEMVFKNVLDKIHIIGTDEKAIFWIDKEVGAMASSEERK